MTSPVARFVRLFMLAVMLAIAARPAAAQDDSGTMIAKVEGSFSNVMGLPMEKLEAELAELASLLGWQ